jgi:hypothetical protein
MPRDRHSEPNIPSAQRQGRAPRRQATAPVQGNAWTSSAQSSAAAPTPTPSAFPGNQGYGFNGGSQPTQSTLQQFGGYADTVAREAGGAVSVFGSGFGNAYVQGAGNLIGAYGGGSDAYAGATNPAGPDAAAVAFGVLSGGGAVTSGVSTMLGSSAGNTAGATVTAIAAGGKAVKGHHEKNRTKVPRKGDSVGNGHSPHRQNSVPGSSGANVTGGQARRRTGGSGSGSGSGR